MVTLLSFISLQDLADRVGIPLDKIQTMADKGWFHGQEIDGEFRVQEGDSEFRCSMIHHAKTHFGFSEDEVNGMIRSIEETDIGVMGGGKVTERYQPFEQELAKAGPRWICVALGEHSKGAPIHFTIHGDLNLKSRHFMILRDDSVCMHEGEITIESFLERDYGRGVVRNGLPCGNYRIHCGGAASYRFRVSEKAGENAGRLFLRYFRGTRCGEKTEFHPACHLDDGIRDDTGEYFPLTGGWHDAGDFCHITSTTTASFYMASALCYINENNPISKLLEEEAMHGADFNLRARDTETGKIFEKKGAGRGWSKHGCFGDNQRLTDNQINSGDERRIGTEGKLETALDNLAALGMICTHKNIPAEFSVSCHVEAEKSWRYYEDKPDLGLIHTAKRAYTTLAWYQASGHDKTWSERISPVMEKLRNAVDDDGDFIEFNGRILLGSHYQHGLPFLALALVANSDHKESKKARETAIRAADRMVWLSKLHPYGVTCYAVTRNQDIGCFTIGDGLNQWHELGGGKSYRLYQPFTSRFWQGSASQLSVLGIGLAILGRLLNSDEYLALAARHWDWCMGMNPYQCCLTHGWGECEAAALSTMVGYMPGGTIQGPIGDQEDVPYFQVGRGMRVGEEPAFNFAGPSYSREYWSPLSGALLWLRILLMTDNL